MRKTLFRAGLIGIMLVIGLAIIGCGGGGSSPSTVVKRLYTAIEKGDTKAYNELMTPEAASMMIMFGEKAKGQVEKTGKIVKTEEEIDGDTATVKVTFEDGNTEDFELVKKDGKWKVNFDK